MFNKGGDLIKGKYLPFRGASLLEKGTLKIESEISKGLYQLFLATL